MKQSVVSLSVALTLILSSMTYAENTPQSLVSLRSGGTLGLKTIEIYSALVLEGRYAITDRFELGASFESSILRDMVLEMPSKVEKLAPSGEIDGYGTARVGAIFALFHPRGRDHRLDYYVGGGLTCYLLDIGDETGEGYHVEIDTPPAFGLTVKAGTHWFVRDNLAFTLDVEAGPALNQYSAKDTISGFSEDLDSPDGMVHLGVGISYRF